MSSGIGNRELGIVRANRVATVRFSYSRFSIPHSRQKGFTLIELVAAFVIFALGFGILLQILTSALHTTTQSADYTKAALWAQSLLDTQGIGEKLQEGSSSGRFDNEYRWQLRIAKYDPPPVATIAPANSPFANVAGGSVGTPVQTQFEMYQLELIVSWGTIYLTHNARFTTLRVINPNQQAPGGIPGMPGNQLPARQGANG
jgi:general secretion pathway protein I